MTELGRDKRREPRVPAQHLVRAVQEKPGAGAAEVTGRTLDLTENGLRLESSDYLPFLADVGVDLALGDEIVRVKGRIVYLKVDDETDNFQVGIAFTEVADADRGRIRSFLEARSDPS